MAQPTLRYWSWPNVLPQLFSMAVLIALWWFFLPPGNDVEPFLFGAFTYLLYSYGARYLIPRAHRRGMKAMSREKLDEAIREFHASYEFFSKNEWIDRYRSVTLMSPSIWSYREMALMNIASVFASQGDFDATEIACQRVLKEYPDNHVAKSTIGMIRSKSSRGEA